MLDVQVDFSIQKVDKIFKILDLLGRFLSTGFMSIIAAWLFLNLKLKKLKKEVKIYEKVHEELD